MPQFAPGEKRVAVATLKVQPAGIACESELWLGDGAKSASSGLIPFTSTGSPQEILHPIVMPSGGTFYPNLVIYAEGKPALVYRHPEAVFIAIVPIIADFYSATSTAQLDSLRAEIRNLYQAGVISPEVYNELVNAYRERYNEFTYWQFPYIKFPPIPLGAEDWPSVYPPNYWEKPIAPIGIVNFQATIINIPSWAWRYYWMLRLRSDDMYGEKLFYMSFPSEGLQSLSAYMDWVGYADWKSATATIYIYGYNQWDSIGISPFIPEEGAHYEIDYLGKFIRKLS